jgi:uncharacterized protein
MIWKKIKKWFWILLIIYTVIGVAFYFLQDRILFHPVQFKNDQAFDFPQPHEDITIVVRPEEAMNLVHFYSTDTVKRGAVLYFHGNKKNISWYARYIPYFTRHGYEVLMIDYPGFGKSKGKLTEQRLYDWALQVYKLAHNRYAADSIIIYGKSMGTGIAAWLASARDCRRLILETPYYDFPSVVSQFMPIYPVKWMLHYQLPTHAYLSTIEAPVSIFHGTRDAVIRYQNAERLRPLLKKRDEFITIKGGKHNNLYQYDLTLKKLDSLLSQ